MRSASCRGYASHPHSACRRYASQFAVEGAYLRHAFFELILTPRQGALKSARQSRGLSRAVCLRHTPRKALVPRQLAKFAIFSQPLACRPAHNNVIHTHRNMAICRKNLCKSVRSVGDSEGQCGIMSVWRGMLCQPAGKKFPEPQLRSSGNCGYASCRHLIFLLNKAAFGSDFLRIAEATY